MKPIPAAIIDKEPDSSTQNDPSTSIENTDIVSANLDTESQHSKNFTQPLRAQHTNDVELEFDFNSEIDIALDADSPNRNDNLPVRLFLAVPVIIGLLLSVYLYYPSSDDNPLSTTNSSVTSTQRVVFPEQKLEIIAERLIANTNLWNSGDINDFVKLWNSLTKPTRQDLADTIWYKHFAFVLSGKLKEITRHTSSNVMLVGSNASPIVTLAFTLDLLNTDEHFTNRKSENKKFSQLLAKVQSELSKVDTAQQQASINDATSPLLNDALRLEFEATPAVSKNTTVNPTIKPDILITGDKIRDLLAAFKTAYKAGEIEKIQTLFVIDEQTSGSTLVSDLFDSYKSIFKNSTSRVVNLTNLQWKYNGYTATATGLYQTDINLPDNNGTQIINASIEIELHILNSQLKIAKFMLRDKKIIESNPNTLVMVETFDEEMPFLATEDVPTIPVVLKTKTPSETELNIVVSKFVIAYESGDIQLLTSVLSDDIKTNDKTSLKIIKQDYIDLFAKSSVREMKIEKIQWEFKNDHAKGTGKLSASITVLKNKSINLVKGKIQFVVKRINNKIVITHLYHLEHNQ